MRRGDYPHRPPPTNASARRGRVAPSGSAPLHLRSLLLLVVAALLWLSHSPTATAQPAPEPLSPRFPLHAVLLRADPPPGSVLAAEPQVVRLWFSEPVHPVSVGIIVLDANDRRVSLGAAQATGTTLAARLAPAGVGTYVVRWQVISSDTHPLQGTYTFSVGHPSRGSAPSAASTDGSLVGLLLQVLARWLHFTGYALGFGTLAFGLLVLRPLDLPPREAVERRLRRLVSLGITLLLTAEAIALLAQVISLGAGTPRAPSVGDIAGDALASEFGRVLSQRVGAALFLWILVGVADNAAPSSDSPPSHQDDAPSSGGARILRLAPVPLGLALALVDGEASHAIDVNPAWFGLGINALHIAAMGLWVGGLITLITLWDATELRDHRGAVVARFSRVALVALALIALTGLVLAWEQVQPVANLVATPYGRALTIKLLAVAAVLAAAFVASRAHRERQRVHWWLAEAVALAGVLALAGLLASLAPPV